MVENYPGITAQNKLGSFCNLQFRHSTVQAINTMTAIEAGTVVRIHSLKSAAGKRLNGRRAAVIRYIEEESRWQVRVEEEEGVIKTKAIKEDNLSPVRRLPLPTGPYRGVADPMNDIDNAVTKLCELLLYYKGAGPDNPDGDFQPSEIVFMGYAAMAFNRMGESNFMCFFSTQMEQMGGVLALGNICREGGECGTEAVLFGLLEGSQMYVDVLIQTMHWTGEIVEDGPNIGRDGFNGPPTELTPDQDARPYARTMSEGPVLLLESMARWSFAPVLWAAMAKSEFYHLLIQRLLRWIAREAQKTRDGLALGIQARKIMTSMFPDISSALTKPVSIEVAAAILSDSPDMLQCPGDVDVETLTKIIS